MKEMPFKKMDEAAYRIAYLIAGFIRKTLTETEHDELDAWVETSDENMLLFEELTDEKNIEENLAWLDKIKTEQALEVAKTKIQFTKEDKSIARSKWYYGVAASVLLLIAAFTIYKISTQQKVSVPEIAKLPGNDIQPGKTKATLTLGDGNIIDLEKAKNGLLKKENGVAIIKSPDGEVFYTNENNSANNLIKYNTLSIPKGGQYKVQLPDGSMVWLNSASSLKYPTAFNTPERLVELEGEGYFEISKDKKHPFKVKLNNGVGIKVLGTHFNVTSYQNDEAKKITLLEGSVEITSGNKIQKLKPGQQGEIISDEIKVKDVADTSEIIGWKNGQFIFHDADIQTIMTQVNRWYDVEIKYEAKVNQQFNAVISRDEPVSRLLHLLEQTGEIHFKIENNIIYVLP